jgi:hypothetical protein
MKNVLLCLLVSSLPALAQTGVENTQGDVTIRAARIPAAAIARLNPTFALPCVCDEIQVTVKTQAAATLAFKVTVAYNTSDGQSGSVSVVQAREAASKPSNLVSVLLPESAVLSSVTVNELKPDPDLVFKF